MKKFWVALLVVSVLTANDVTLNKKEKEYIQTHTFKCITTTAWAPFNTLKNGKLAGISVDFWKLVKNKLHIKSHCIIAPTWSSVIDAIKNKRADITLGTDITPEKEKFAVFTKPYAVFPIAIATRNDVGYIGAMIFLKNKKIVVGKNYTVAHLLKTNYPNLRIMEVKDIKTALEMVSEGKAYAAIDVMPVLVYNINKYSFANLKIAGKTPFTFKMRFMLSKNNKILVDAINKAIDSIDEIQKREIYKKWISVTYQEGYTLKQVLTIIFSAALIIILLILWITILKHEIKKRKEIEKKLQKLSVIDSLTGIYNRYKIDTALKKQISFAKRHNNPLSVIFFDIDHFKKINDTFGHKIGDEILKELTDLIKSNLREYDIFGRWGGEEFIIILPNTSIIQAVKVTKKIKNIIESHKFKYVDRLTCSFGVTEMCINDTLESILDRVDTYMYEAKKRGRNKIISDLNV